MTISSGLTGIEEFKGSKFTGTAEGDTLVINMDWSGGSFVPFGTIMNYRLIMSPDGNSITAYGTPYGKLEQQVIFTAKRMSGSPIDLASIAIGVLVVAGGGIGVYVIKNKKAKAKGTGKVVVNTPQAPSKPPLKQETQKPKPKAPSTTTTTTTSKNKDKKPTGNESLVQRSRGAEKTLGRVHTPAGRL